MMLRRLQQKDKINPLKYLTFETLGNTLIILSGVLPFAHVLIKDVKLPEKFFGYSSIHRFAYSLGNHLSLFFIVLGLLILIPIFDKDNINIYKNNLKFSLLSPFISATFFMTWVFIPGVNFNILAYTFIGLAISAISVFLVLKLMSYIKLLKITYIYKEKLLNKGLNYIDNNL